MPAPQPAAVPGRGVRYPQQQRSRERVGRIIDAAETLLVEHGHPAVTVRRIAGQAGVATGTVYQFFPDKEAILQVLVERYLALFVDAMAELAAQRPPASADALVDRVLDRYIDLYRQHPGYRALWSGRHLSAAALAADEQNNTDLAEGLSLLLVGYGFASAGDPTVRVACQVAVLVADALLQAAFRQQPAGDPALIAQARLVEKGYLAMLSLGADR